jgi:hypothetical protein
MKKLFIIVFVAILAYSCYWENEETLYPITDKECDTTQITFTADIAPMLATYCYSCHSNLNAPSFGSNIKLEDYDDVSSFSATILSSIRHEQGFQPMPKGGTQLNECYILSFEAWTNNGKPVN